MVGDYIATAFVQSPADQLYRAMPVIAVPRTPAPNTSPFDQGMWAPAGGLDVLGGLVPAGHDPVLFTGPSESLLPQRLLELR